MRKKKSILEYWPYPEFRPSQKELLLAIEKAIPNADVLVITAPVASGKSAISQTVARWLGDTAVIFPTNALLDQYLAEFPSFPKLHKKDRYICPLFKEEGHKCSYISTKFKNKVKCIDCEYKTDKKRAFIKYIGAYNYFTYMALKLYHSHLIVDEATNLIRMIQDMAGKKFWQKDLLYPNWTYSYADVLDWFSGLEYPTPKQVELMNYASSEKLNAIMERSLDFLRGEQEDVLKLTPLSVADHPPVLWPPHRVKKIILLSATISQIDIKDLGLDKDRRVIYLDTDSALPVPNKPLICDSIGSLNYSNIFKLKEVIANKILEIADKQSTYGFVHTTYGMAKLLKELLPNNRFLFHESKDAGQKLRDWLAGKYNHQVFVGCGFEEGVDLAGDLYQWQIITKIQYPSLADPAIKFRSQQTGVNGTKWYVWSTLKKVMQATGRIARSPTDYGETWIIDGSFDRLVNNALELDLVPKWFKEMLFPTTLNEELKQ